MKSKAMLPLIEQICMIAFFAIAAVLCLKGFALANEISRERNDIDTGAVKVQNVAEVLKSCKGDFDRAADLLECQLENGTITVYYDSKWQKTDSEAEDGFIITARKQNSDVPLLEKALISAYSDEDSIFSLTVGWGGGTDR